MSTITGLTLKNMLLAAAYKLEQQRDIVNALNVFPVPDGDTGTNMSLTLKAALKELEQAQSEEINKMTSLLARGSLMGARGNSGVILSQFFRGFAEGLEKVKKTATGQDLARAFSMSSKTTYRAVMKPVEGTILTVARLASEAALETAEAGGDVEQVLKVLLEEARRTLANTPNILPVLKEAGVVDAGGQGLVYIFEGFYTGLKADPQEFQALLEAPAEQVTVELSSLAAEEVFVNKYCTEFIILGTDLDADIIRRELEPKGDSMIVVGDPDLLKVHVHTDVPGEILQFCAGFGDLTEIAIDNMYLQNREYEKSSSLPQHRHRLDYDLDNVVDFPHNASGVEEKKVGVVAVVPGQGLAEIYTSLGVDCVVPGGQTMNPSTEDLVKAVNSVQAEAVVVLPNNKNVIFSAQQARELAEKKVGVVPTRSIPQGISALMNFSADESLEENVAAMEACLKEVKTGEVTYAVRATVAGNLQIEEKDIIGLAEGKIAVVGSDPVEVALQLLETMVDADSSVISVYYGADQEQDKVRELEKLAQEQYGECEVEVYNGGQPFYYYIVSVE